MREDKHGVNAITLPTTELLLTGSGGGSAVHLAELAEPGLGRGAVPEHWFEPEQVAHRAALVNYDRDALLAARWGDKTLCGRAWLTMVGGDGGSISMWGGEPEFAPTCRRCLALMDRMFPAPLPHPRLPLVVRLAVDVVAACGYTEVCEVPGDQQTDLRRQIRSLIRAETGHPCQTLVHGGTVYVVCEPISESHRDEHMAEAARAMEGLLLGGASQPRPEPDWRIYWSTWATD